MAGTHMVDDDDNDGSKVERLFERTVRRMLKTPPKPHKDMKLGKSARRGEPDPRGAADDERPTESGRVERQ